MDSDNLKFVCLSMDNLVGGQFGIGRTVDEAVTAARKTGMQAGAAFYVQVTDSPEVQVARDGSIVYTPTERFPFPKFAAMKRHKEPMRWLQRFATFLDDLPDKKTLEGTAENLEGNGKPVLTWIGWALYRHEAAVATETPERHTCSLSATEPEMSTNDRGWLLTPTTVEVHPQFLTDCGIAVPWDVPFGSPEERDFYHNHRCRHGCRPPVPVSLTLPRSLLQALKLLES